MNNINSLTEDIVSSVENLYTDTLDKLLKKVRKGKINSTVHKNKQFSKKECLTKQKELKVTCNDARMGAKIL